MRRSVRARRPVALALVTGAALVLAACSSDGGGGDAADLQGEGSGDACTIDGAVSKQYGHLFY